jgi:2-polyprenyl-6-methoxyphenol hydroxylase-like FAD-dependent oxidoreductase
MSPPSLTLPCDVLIVGAGIAGAAAACALRERGLRLVQVEMSTGPLDTARGDHLQCSVVEILERWGALPALLAAGAEKRHGARYQSVGGAPILDIDYSSLKIPHPYYLYLHHELIASTLLALAARAPGYLGLRGVRARNFELSDGGLRALEVTLPPELPAPEGVSPGQRLRIEPRLVIGADGRSSRVREALGFAAEQHEYQSPVVLQLAPRRPEERDPRNLFTMFIGPEGTISRIPRAFGGWKLGTTITRAEIGFWKRATLGQRRAAVAALAPELEALEPELAGFYPVKLLNTRRWTTGNTVLVGDACHAMHPARGQGMNVAIRCLDRLVAGLPEAADFGKPEVVAAALAAYEARTRPGIEPLLAENHAQGAARDVREPGQGLRMTAELQRVQDDPKRLAAYTRRSAGYGTAWDGTA